MTTAMLGFDIGGTTTRAALVFPDGTVTQSDRTPTPASLSSLADWIEGRVRLWNSARDLHIPVGIAVPGVVNPVTGVCTRCINLPWLEGHSLADVLESRIGHRVILLTDAQAATWGEYAGAGKPSTVFAHLRLGTGVACCIVREGRLLPIDPTRKTHWPILVVDRSANALACPCGLRGCLECFAAGPALLEQTRVLGLDSLGELNRVSGTRPDALDLLNQTSLHICEAIANLQREFAIDTIVLGGGVMTVIPSLLHLIRSNCGATGVNIREAQLGDDAGVVGAALAAREASLSG